MSKSSELHENLPEIVTHTSNGVVVSNVKSLEPAILRCLKSIAAGKNIYIAVNTTECMTGYYADAASLAYDVVKLGSIELNDSMKVIDGACVSINPSVPYAHDERKKADQLVYIENALEELLEELPSLRQLAHYVRGLHGNALLLIGTDVTEGMKDLMNEAQDSSWWKDNGILDWWEGTSFPDAPTEVAHVVEPAE